MLSLYGEGEEKSCQRISYGLLVSGTEKKKKKSDMYVCAIMLKLFLFFFSKQKKKFFTIFIKTHFVAFV